MNNLSYKFKLRNDRANKKGERMLLLVLTRNRERQFISMKIYVDPNYWDAEQERLIIKKGLRTKDALEENEHRRKNNFFIDKMKLRVDEVLQDLSKKNPNFTLNQIKEVFLNKPQESKIQAFFEKHISTLRETNHVGNANTFAITLKMLNLFDRKLAKRLFGEVDLKYIKEFDGWMQKRGCKGNTRMHYHKKLRAIWNMAIAEKEVSSELYPFGKGGFEVGKLEEETEKRYLPREYFEKLKTTPSKKATSEFARNVFLLSYYMYGISFRDMALLTSKNVVKLNKGEYIVYKRTKTKTVKRTKAISIKRTPEINELISALSEFKQPLSDYLVPLVSVEKDTEDKLYSHISDRRKTVVGWMKELAKEFDIDFNLTSYVSRHTMAMQLQDKEIPESVISQILGHKDLRTTKTYLDSLDTSVIDEAVKVL